VFVFFEKQYGVQSFSFGRGGVQSFSFAWVPKAEALDSKIPL